MIDDNEAVETREILDVSFWPSLKELEKLYIYMVLKKSKGNKSRAAKTLGLSYGGLLNKLVKISNQTLKSVEGE